MKKRKFYEIIVPAIHLALNHRGEKIGPLIEPMPHLLPSFDPEMDEIISAHYDAHIEGWRVLVSQPHEEVQ